MKIEDPGVLTRISGRSACLRGPLVTDLAKIVLKDAVDWSAARHLPTYVTDTMHVQLMGLPAHHSDLISHTSLHPSVITCLAQTSSISSILLNASMSRDIVLCHTGLCSKTVFLLIYGDIPSSWAGDLFSPTEDGCSLMTLAPTMLQACDEHTSHQIQKLAASQVADEVIFLRQMHQCWESHTSQMLTIRSIFLYLDRSYVLSASSVRSLYEMGLQQFRIHLVQQSEVAFSAPPS